MDVGCYLLQMESLHSSSSTDGSSIIMSVQHSKNDLLSYGSSANNSEIWDNFSVVLFLLTVRIFSVLQLVRHNNSSGFWTKIGFLALFFFVLLIGIVDTIKSVERFANRITSFEFTAIFVAINRFFYVGRNMFAVVKIYMVRHTISHIFTTVNKFCLPPNNSQQASLSIRRKLRVLALLLWLTGIFAILTVLLACYLCFRGIAYRKLANTSNTCGWTCSTEYPVFGWSPLWATFLFYCLGFIILIGVDVFPQLLVMLIIYPLGLRFVDFAKSLKEETQTNLIPCLRRQTAFHLELSKIVLEMDATFSFLYLLMYTSDLMGFIATTSLMLHHKNGLYPGNIDRELLPIFLALVVVSSFLAMIRTGFGVWLSEKAHSILPYLYELNLRVTSEEDKFLCSSFISRLQGSRVALTAGGFFYITREFVITIFGVLLTYVLFVYQMQDQKLDMSLLPKLQEIVSSVAFAHLHPANNFTMIRKV